MKKLACAVILTANLCLGVLLAQDAPSELSPPPPSRNGSAPAGARATASRPPLPPALKENIKLAVKAEIVDGYPMAFAQTGIGAEFSYSQIIEPGQASATPGYVVDANFQAIVTQVPAGYQVDFTLTYEVPTVMERSGVSAVRYAAQTVKSTVVAKLGVPLEITGAGGKAATLTISRPTTK